MRRASRKVVISLAVALVGVAVLLILVGNRDSPADCEIAQVFYNPNEEETFETFLENQFRVIGVIVPGGFFSDPRYSFAIYHPKKEFNKYKLYEYLISRAGIPHSRMAISTSKEGWESFKKIECD